jgi:hypothetical protein
MEVLVTAALVFNVDGVKAGRSENNDLDREHFW